VSTKPLKRAPAIEGELLDFDGAGALLGGYSGRTVRRMVERGGFVAAIEVPGVRGKRLRRADILAWLAALSAPCAGAGATGESSHSVAAAAEATGAPTSLRGELRKR